MRGTPAGRQLASGSSLGRRPFISLSAAGVRTICSPTIRLRLMSWELGPPFKRPLRSGFPSARRETGPAGAAGPRPRPAGALAPAAAGSSAQTETPSANATIIEETKRVLMSILFLGVGSRVSDPTPLAITDSVRPHCPRRLQTREPCVHPPRLLAAFGPSAYRL